LWVAAALRRIRLVGRRTLRKLLLATDLTPRDDRAFDRAVQIASAGGSKLTMLHVVNDDRVLGQHR